MRNAESRCAEIHQHSGEGGAERVGDQLDGIDRRGGFAPSPGSETAFIAPTARCGQAMPTPAPAMTNPTIHAVIAPAPA